MRVRLVIASFCSFTLVVFGVYTQMPAYVHADLTTFEENAEAAVGEEKFSQNGDSNHSFGEEIQFNSPEYLCGSGKPLDFVIHRVNSTRQIRKRWFSPLPVGPFSVAKEPVRFERDHIFELQLLKAYLQQPGTSLSCATVELVNTEVVNEQLIPTDLNNAKALAFQRLIAGKLDCYDVDLKHCELPRVQPLFQFQAHVRKARERLQDIPQQPQNHRRPRPHEDQIPYFFVPYLTTQDFTSVLLFETTCKDPPRSEHPNWEGVLCRNDRAELLWRDLRPTQPHPHVPLLRQTFPLISGYVLGTSDLPSHHITDLVRRDLFELKRFLDWLILRNDAKLQIAQRVRALAEANQREYNVLQERKKGRAFADQKLQDESRRAQQRQHLNRNNVYQ